MQAVFKTVAAVLHVGNISFLEEGQGSPLKQNDALSISCAFLGLDQASLAHALCFRHIKTRDEEYEVPQNVMQACVARDALAKSVYSRQFDWLVTCVNDALAGVESSSDTLGINVLDIYGFEVLNYYVILYNIMLYYIIMLCYIM